MVLKETMLSNNLMEVDIEEGNHIVYELNSVYMIL
jgi:hypothetical protein